MRSIYLLILMTLLVGCGDGDSPPPQFDGEQAFTYLEHQVAFGPRVPGTEPWRLCREYFYEHFEQAGLSVDSQAFTFYDPYSNSEKPLVNVIAQYRGDPSDEKALLLAAHWDSRPRTDFHSDSTRMTEPIDGANDGASGVAVLMELADLLAEQAPEVNVDLVLFDGEDWGKSGDIDLYLLGSRHFARGIRGRYHFGIVIDMVGDKHQEIYKEGYSQEFQPVLNDYIWNQAKGLGLTTFHDSVKYTIMDDHLSLLAAGLPSVVLIDFDYPYWHTELDTPDKCSPESLANVGRLLADIVYKRSSWPKLK